MDKEYTVDELSNILSAHVNNKNFFRAEQNTFNNNTIITGDYYGKNLRRIYYENCRFIDANLEKAGFTGAVFKDCSFSNVNFTGTNMSQCTFTNCDFYGDIISSNFDGSYFEKLTFNNAKISDSIFSNATFSNVSFIDCEWLSVYLENSTFYQTAFNHVIFSKLNFEFVEIKECHFLNTSLPFQALIYMFGGLNYALTTDDNVKIKSNTTEKGCISISEYKSLIPIFKKFYLQTNNYFPLANIYIATNEVDKAYEAIVDGITYACHISQYRLIKFYCNLFLKATCFSIYQRAMLFSSILETIQTKSNSANIKLSKHLLEARNLLLYHSETGYATISLKTNIKEENLSDLNILLKNLEGLIQGNKVRYHYEFRHNSPYEITVYLLDNLPAITAIVSSITSVYVMLRDQKKTRKKSDEQIKGLMDKIQEQDKELLYLKIDHMANELAKKNIDIKVEIINAN